MHTGVHVGQQLNQMASYCADLYLLRAGRYCDRCETRITEQEIYTCIDGNDYCQDCEPLQ